ncbi:MAG: cytochrome c [Sphingomonadales bacterium]|nr:cytochrome c [Sphingomonadales bacterium]
MKQHHGMMAALAIGALAFGGAALAASASTTIQARQANFKQLGKGMKAVMTELKADAPNVDAIKAGAALIDGAAPKVAGFFPKGTGPEAGVKTEALPVIWQKGPEFKAAAEKLVNASKGLNAAAATGDVARIKAAAGALGGACKGCHDTFKAKD